MGTVSYALVVNVCSIAQQSELAIALDKKLLSLFYLATWGTVYYGLLVNLCSIVQQSELAIAFR